ncbi:MAG: allophanate hydrolase subunit 2 family protein, partial [Flavobacteriaceae bacterium]
LKRGLRIYLAIKGGIQIPEILGSRSYFKSITSIDSIRSGDEIPYSPISDFKPKISSIKTDSLLKKQHIDVHEGPEFNLLDPVSREQLFNTAFTIAKEYNRMAYQLQEKINSPKISMITSANLPGTVQLTPSGKLIILMRDGQTTGGYPRVLQLDENAISVLAQKKFGDQIYFDRV